MDLSVAMRLRPCWESPALTVVFPGDGGMTMPYVITLPNATKNPNRMEPVRANKGDVRAGSGRDPPRAFGLP